MFTEQQKREAQVRKRARSFADHLRSERWAENIPDAHIEFCTDEEIESIYKPMLREKNCVQRDDFKWEAR